MKKENLRIILAGLAFSLFPVFSFAQELGENVIAVNVGEMYIGANGGSPAMLVTRSLALGNSSTDESIESKILVGNTEEPTAKLAIGGSVYQVATKENNHGFAVIDGKPSSTGTVVFVDVPGINNDVDPENQKVLDWHIDPGTPSSGDGGKHGHQHPMGSHKGDSDNENGHSARFIAAMKITNDVVQLDHLHKHTVFSRKSNYLAFPNIEIATKDRINIPPQMGIDVKNIHRNEEVTGKTGKLYLESAAIGKELDSADEPDGQTFNASLRVLGDEVAPGSVWVECDLNNCRVNVQGTVGPDLESSSLVLDINRAWRPFAAPFIDLPSGHFAGNFVRKPIYATDGSGHVEHPLANSVGADDENLIAREHYITKASDNLTAGEAYVLNVRPNSYNYANLAEEYGGLWETDAHNDGNTSDNYQRNVFVFGADVYSLDKKATKLFIGNELFNPEAKKYTFPKNRETTNWVIGNSYTAGISAQKLVQAMYDSPIKFNNRIWIFTCNGAQTFQPYSINTDNIEAPFNFVDLYDIPTQSTFMIQLAEQEEGKETFSATDFAITKEMLVHGDTPIGDYDDWVPKNSGTKGSNAQGNEFWEEVLFSVTPKQQARNRRDVTLMGFRSKAKESFDDIDLEKMYNGNSEAFQLYSHSTDNRMLSGNAMGMGAASAPLSFKPSSVKEDFVLSASRLESLTTEIVWLEDLKTNEITDLRATGDYEFTAAPGDSPHRFKVHFKRKSLEDKVKLDGIVVDYKREHGQVKVTGLIEQDKGSQLLIFNALGKLIKKHTITEIPETILSIDVVDGVYVAAVQGYRNVSKKFVVKKLY